MAFTGRERVNVKNGLFDDVYQLTLATLQPPLTPNVCLHSLVNIAQVTGSNSVLKLDCPLRG